MTLKGIKRRFESEAERSSYKSSTTSQPQLTKTSVGFMG